MDENKRKALEAKGMEIVETLKVMVKKGNVARIRVKKDEKKILDIPVTAGAVGAAIGIAFAPWALIIAAIVGVGAKCTVEVEKEDGTITKIYG